MEISAIIFCILKAVVFILSICDLSYVKARASDRCPGIVKQTLRNKYSVRVFEEQCYVFIPDEETWVEAEKTCSSWNGHLLSIPNYGVMRFIRDTLNKDLRWQVNGVWIGANARKSGRGWHWTTGERITYTNWASGQPSKTLGWSFEDCGLMRRAENWKWHDYHCKNTLFYTYRFICQFRKLPRTTTTTTATTTTTTTTTTVTTTKVTTQSTSTPVPAPTTHDYTSTTHDVVVVFGKSKSEEVEQGFRSRIEGKASENSHKDPLAASADESINSSETNDSLLIGFVCGAVIMLVLFIFGFVFCRKRLRKKQSMEEPSVRFENLGYARVDSRAQNIYMGTNEMHRLYDVVTKEVDHGVNQYAVSQSYAVGDAEPEDMCCGPPPAYESLKAMADEPPPPRPCLNNQGKSADCSDLPEYDFPSASSSLDKNLTTPLPPLPCLNTKVVQNNVRECEYVDMSGGNSAKTTNLIADANRIIDPEKPSNLQQEAIYANDNLENERLENGIQSDVTLRVPSSDEHSYELTDEEHALLDQDPDPVYEVVH